MRERDRQTKAGCLVYRHRLLFRRDELLPSATAFLRGPATKSDIYCRTPDDSIYWYVRSNRTKSNKTPLSANYVPSTFCRNFVPLEMHKKQSSSQNKSREKINIWHDCRCTKSPDTNFEMLLCVEVRPGWVGTQDGILVKRSRARINTWYARTIVDHSQEYTGTRYVDTRVDTRAYPLHT